MKAQQCLVSFKRPRLALGRDMTSEVVPCHIAERRNPPFHPPHFERIGAARDLTEKLLG